MKYVKVDDLQAYCDNQIDHSITPNDFQRMKYLEVVRCKDCVHIGNMYKCPVFYSKENQPDDWFCADGKRR